jgi:hypothetical protein
MAWEDLTAAQQRRMSAFASKIGAPDPATTNMGQFWARVQSIINGGTQATAAVRRQATSLKGALLDRASQ